MGLFEQRVAAKMNDPEFAAGYAEAEAEVRAAAAMPFYKRSLVAADGSRYYDDIDDMLADCDEAARYLSETEERDQCSNLG